MIEVTEPLTAANITEFLAVWHWGHSRWVTRMKDVQLIYRRHSDKWQFHVLETKHPTTGKHGWLITRNK